MSKGGYFGKILYIDLTHHTSSVQQLSEDLQERYVGGRGIGTALLMSNQNEGIDPLSPGNHLIIMNGPLTGANVPGSSRTMFITKSPATNTCSSSSMGGSFPWGFKRTGYDGVIIAGKSEKAIWVEISPLKVEFHPAEGLKGLKTSETEKRIKKIVDGRSWVSCIGPAGEHLVKYAAIVSETRTAARGGIGAVMGSKNLKAIAVSGDIITPIADKNRLKEINKRIQTYQKENISTISLKANGTASMINIINTMDVLPTKNYQKGTFQFADKICGEEISRTRRIKGKSCMSCTVGCSLFSQIQSGEYNGVEVEGPEYESVVMFGSNLLIDDLDTILAANYLCDEYGLDTISTGNVIGYAMECFEKGIFTLEETEGLELKWGDGGVVLTLIKKIAENRGIGSLLGQGVKRMSDLYPQSKSFAIHVKGLEIAGYEPRGIVGQGLSYAICPRGGDHGKGGYMIADLFMEGDDLYDYRGKGKRAVELSEVCAINDIAQVCNFNFIPNDLIAELMSAVIGTEFHEKELKEIARDVITLEREFNLREGLTRQDDTLPPRFLTEGLPDGVAKGKIITHLEEMIGEYYKYMGWNDKGIPYPRNKRKKRVRKLIKKDKKLAKKAQKSSTGGESNLDIESLQVSWEEEVKEKLAQLIQATPKAFREASKQNLLTAVKKRIPAEGAISMEILIESVTEVTPKAFLKTTLKNFD